MARQVFRNRTGLEITQADLAYIGGTSSAAVSGQLSQVQLFNPVGSGVKLFVQRIRARSSGGTSVYPTTTPIATLTTDSFNKRVASGAPAATAQIRTGSAVSPGGGSKNEALVEVIETDIPGSIDPGFGINVEGTTANQEAGALFEWIEVAN